MKRDITAAIYPRLSRDDGVDGDSNSIASQKKLLTKIAREKGYTNILTFVDDGVSGVTMNRPGFNQMMGELEKGYIGAVFVKDLSRLGRNYIEVGKLTEEFFPERDMRLVAVADGVDSAEGDNDLNPIRNLFNEWYARDISKKRRIGNRVKGNAGEPLGPPPYGYMLDPENSKRWIIDPEAAEMVSRIFEMTQNGKGTEQIADALTQDRIAVIRIHGCVQQRAAAGEARALNEIGDISLQAIDVVGNVLERLAAAAGGKVPCEVEGLGRQLLLALEVAVDATLFQAGGLHDVVE